MSSSSNSAPAILSVDLGRTASKITDAFDTDRVVLVDANVKELPLDDIRGGVFESRSTDPIYDLWIEYKGSGYALGQLAADYGADLGVGKSKVDGAVVKVLAAAGYFNLEGNIELVLGLPYLDQEQFETEKERLLGLLEGEHNYLFRKQERYVNFVKIWVMPEGYGSLIWSESQQGESDIEEDLTRSAVAIIDIGHQTTDFLMIDNFRFSRATSKSENYAMDNFYESLAEEIEGATSQSVALIEAVHRKPGSRFYRPRGVAKPTDLDEFIPAKRELFAKEITKMIIEWLPERVSQVIITGGGGEFFAEDIRKLLKEAYISSTVSVPSRKANVLGQYLYGQAQQSKA